MPPRPGRPAPSDRSGSSAPSGSSSSRGGLGSLGSDSFSPLEAAGGVRGLLETVLPTLVFVLVFPLVGRLSPALWAALGVAGLFAFARLVQGQGVSRAAAGVLGVGVSALFASRSGRAEDFYLPGLWVNAAYASAYALSIVLRFPLLGVFVGPLLGEGLSWRRDPARLRAYSWASAVWVVVFVSRLAVQYPLYSAGMVGALGAARLLMGIPLFALAAYVSWLLLRSTAPSRDPSS